MKKLLFYVLVAIAAWYAWKHWPEIMSHTPGHEAVIVNGSGVTMTRVRLQVDGQTFVKERLADGEKATFPFKVANDASFDLSWENDGRMGEHHWHGGMVPKGPLVQRHFIQIDGDGNVVYEARSKGVGAPPTP